jgi:hypothetical protein
MHQLMQMWQGMLQQTCQQMVDMMQTTLASTMRGEFGQMTYAQSVAAGAQGKPGRSSQQRDRAPAPRIPVLLQRGVPSRVPLRANVPLTHASPPQSSGEEWSDAEQQERRAQPKPKPKSKAKDKDKDKVGDKDRNEEKAKSPAAAPRAVSSGNAERPAQGSGKGAAKQNDAAKSKDNGAQAKAKGAAVRKQQEDAPAEDGKQVAGDKHAKESGGGGKPKPPPSKDGRRSAEQAPPSRLGRTAAQPAAEAQAPGGQVLSQRGVASKAQPQRDDLLTLAQMLQASEDEEKERRLRVTKNKGAGKSGAKSAPTSSKSAPTSPKSAEPTKPRAPGTKRDAHAQASGKRGVPPAPRGRQGDDLTHGNAQVEEAGRVASWADAADEADEAAAADSEREEHDAEREPSGAVDDEQTPARLTGKACRRWKRKLERRRRAQEQRSAAGDSREQNAQRPDEEEFQVVRSKKNKKKSDVKAAARGAAAPPAPRAQ